MISITKSDDLSDNDSSFTGERRGGAGADMGLTSLGTGVHNFEASFSIDRGCRKKGGGCLSLSGCSLESPPVCKTGTFLNS